MTTAFSNHSAVASNIPAHGSLRAEERVRQALQHLERFEPMLHAWVSVDAQAALQHAIATGALPIRDAPLRGITFGIKDVLDIAGQITRAGSRTRADSEPAGADAWIVAALRRAGAAILGKTTTTEYATMDPCETRNPWNPAHTPGGSSSGSAAAIAAGMIAAATGTQTAGSLCRPAAYCGISAFKPSYGLIPTEGMLPLAPSFDTIGIMAAAIEDCRHILHAVLDMPPPVQDRFGRIARPKASYFSDADAEALQMLDAAADLAAGMGYQVETMELPFNPPAVLEAHKLVMACEIYHCHSAMYHRKRGMLGPRVRELLDIGAATDRSLAAKALDRIADWRARCWQTLGQYDAILTLPAPGSAPRGLSTTGPAHYQIPWTAMHGPLAVLPCRMDRHGMPLACMLAAPPGKDRDLLDLACELGSQLNGLPALDLQKSLAVTEIER